MTYWFWFKPITLNHHMKQVTGKVDLNSSLLRPRVWRGLLSNPALLRLFGYLICGALICFLANGLLWGGLIAAFFPSVSEPDTITTGGDTLTLSPQFITLCLVALANVLIAVILGTISGAFNGPVYGIAYAVAIIEGTAAMSMVLVLISSPFLEVIEALVDVLIVPFVVVTFLAVATNTLIAQAVAQGNTESPRSFFLNLIVLILLPSVIIPFNVDYMRIEILEQRSITSMLSYGGQMFLVLFIFIVLPITILSLRLYIAPLWCVYSTLQWMRARSDLAYAKQALTHSPLQVDELIYVRLPFFDRFVIQCIHANPARREDMLVEVANSIGQKWAAQRAVMQLLFDDMRNVKDLDGMVAQAQSIRAVLDTASQQPQQRLLKPDQAALLARFEHMAEELNVATGEESKYASVQRLNLARQSLKDLLNVAALSRQPQFTQVARHWQELVDRYEQDLTAQRRDARLPNVFSAGNALSPDAPSFRGRADVFAAIEEVSADPRRTEPLLLFGQPRIGKSSVLQQLPRRLANTLSLYVDCLDALNVQGTPGYVSSLSSAIVRCEGVKRRGLRPQALPLDQVQDEPLVRLDNWLNDLAQSVSGRRVVLCFDEFEKIAAKVADGAISPDALDQVRGLSQRPGWLVLFSGTHELDELSAQFANQFKNARRVKVSYLDEASARDLIERPEPDYPQWCESAAVDKIIALTRCQPFLVQAVCASLVRYLNEHKRFVATPDDVTAALPVVFSDYRNYFISVEQALAPDDCAALDAIARGSALLSTPRAIQRLIERDYIEADGKGGYRFQVPLMREWWARRISM